RLWLAEHRLESVNHVPSLVSLDRIRDLLSLAEPHRSQGGDNGLSIVKTPDFAVSIHQTFEPVHN
ncbi:MAG TPA: hypothetical protein VE177_00715, partial [Candidatus Binatus sp.]|nr:hypothetical protein [Candidatus Binatus sp.]